jgi:hypothetical protein
MSGGAAEPAVSAAAALGAALSLAQFLSQAPSMRAMLRTRARQQARVKVSQLPALFQLASCLLWAASAALVRQSTPLLALSAAGAAINAAYGCCFVAAAQPRERAATASRFAAVAGAVGVVVLVLSAYAGFRAPPLLGVPAAVLTGCAVAANTAMFGGPLAACVAAVGDLRADRLPTLLLATSLACAACWTVYGGLAGDANVVIPNAIGVALSAAQLCALVYIKARLAARARAAAAAPPPGLQLVPAAAPAAAAAAAAAVGGKSLLAAPLPANTPAGSLPAALSSTSLDGLVTPRGSSSDLPLLLAAASRVAGAGQPLFFAAPAPGGAVAPLAAAADAASASTSTASAAAGQASSAAATDADVTPDRSVGTPEFVGFSIEEEEEDGGRAAAAAQRDADAVADALRRILAAPTATLSAAASPSDLVALAARLNLVAPQPRRHYSLS